MPITDEMWCKSLLIECTNRFLYALLFEQNKLVVREY